MLLVSFHVRQKCKMCIEFSLNWQFFKAFRLKAFKVWMFLWPKKPFKFFSYCLLIKPRFWPDIASSAQSNWSCTVGAVQILKFEIDSNMSIMCQKFKIKCHCLAWVLSSSQLSGTLISAICLQWTYCYTRPESSIG